MKTIGDGFEERAATWLQCRGLHVVARNFRARTGEIDIIARDDTRLVFIEVRARARGRYASAAASVTRRKQQRIARTAQLFLQCNPQLAHLPCRFDVVAFDRTGTDQCSAEPMWIRGAFSGQAAAP